MEFPPIENWDYWQDWHDIADTPNMLGNYVYDEQQEGYAGGHYCPK